MPIELKDLKRIRLDRRQLLRSAVGAFVVPATLDSPALPFLSNGVQAARAVAAVDASFNFARSAPNVIVERAISTPLVKAQPVSEDLRDKVYPGSLEDQALEKALEKGQAGLRLIDPKEGPLPLITAVTFSDPHVLKLAQMTVATQWARINEGERAEGGTLHLNAYRASLIYLTELQQQNPDSILPGTNLHVEASRRADYAIAAASCPNHTVKNAKILGIVPKDASDDLNVAQWNFSPKGYDRLGNPIIYGVKGGSTIDIVDGEPFEEGSERWGHLTYHNFLVSLHRYFSEPNFFGKNGHPLKDAIPDIVKLGAAVKRFLAPTRQIQDHDSRNISKLVGWLYEAKTTVSGEDDSNRTEKSFSALLRTVGIGNFYANEGLLDTRVWEDVWSNDLGADWAIIKFHLAMNKINPQGVNEQINSDKFRWTGNGQQFLVPVGAGR